MDKRCWNCLHSAAHWQDEPCKSCFAYALFALWEPKHAAAPAPCDQREQAAEQATKPAALPTDPAARKHIPVYSGFVAYFPRGICAIAELSRIGNDQHNPGKPLGWDRSKSGDEKDALMRHLIDQTIDGDQAADTDGVLHATKKAWRAMADLEKILEARANAAVHRRGPDSNE